MNQALTPPHSSEAEQSVLGALLLENASFERCSDLLEASDFYFPDHAAIYTEIVALVAANKPADVVTVHERSGHDMAYLNALASSVPSASNIRGYATIVRERSLRRQLMRIGSTLADDALRGTEDKADVPRLVDGAVTSLMAIVQATTESEPRRISDLLPAFADDVQERLEGKTGAVETGLADLDRLTGGGGRPGELWVLGARPSMGKTAFVLTLSRNVSERGGGVLMLTQEDSLASLTARHVAAAGRVNLADLRNPKAAPETMWDGLSAGLDVLMPLPIYMDDQAALSLLDVRRKVQQVTRRYGKPALVVIDYLQLMEGSGDNRNQELGKIANGLKRTAKEFGAWVILLSQLNREADKRSGPPHMSDLRDSGDIEGAADLIGLLHREFQRKPTAENKFHAELHVVKHKNGQTDTLQFHFDGAYQRFSNWSGSPPGKPGSSRKRGDE